VKYIYENFKELESKYIYIQIERVKNHRYCKKYQKTAFNAIYDLLWQS